MTFDRSWMSPEEAIEVSDDLRKVGGAYIYLADVIRYYNEKRIDARQSQGVRHPISTNGSNRRSN
jgi:hypothetical protein